MYACVYVERWALSFRLVRRLLCSVFVHKFKNQHRYFVPYGKIKLIISSTKISTSRVPRIAIFCKQCIKETGLVADFNQFQTENFSIKFIVIINSFDRFVIFCRWNQNNVCVMSERPSCVCVLSGQCESSTLFLWSWSFNLRFDLFSFKTVKKTLHFTHKEAAHFDVVISSESREKTCVQFVHADSS